MSTVNNGPQIVKNGLVLDLDTSYMRSYSPNVYPNPTDLLGWQYMGTQLQSCNITRDTTITRQYGSIPMKMSITGNDPFAGAYNSSIGILAPALSGQTWTISVWAKATVATDGQLFIFGADTNGAVFTINDYNAGNMSITTSWQRFSFSYTFTNASTRYIQIRLDGTNSGGSGITIWWDGLQVERASSATTFNPYYIGNTTWRDISSNNYNGTINNFPSFSATAPNNFTLNGSTQDITLPSNFNSGLTSASWEFWVNCASLPGTSAVQQIYIQESSVWLAMYNTGGGAFFGCDLNNGSGWFDNNGGNTTGAKTTSTLSANTWYHIVYSWDGTNVRIYLNGNLESTTTTLQAVNGRQNVTVLGTGTTPRSIGSRSGSYFNGKISLAKSYNIALSTAQVTQNYQTTKTRFGL